MESPNLEEENTIKEVRNLFRLEKHFRLISQLNT